MHRALTSRWGIEPVFIAEDPENASGSSTVGPQDDELTGKYLWDCAKVLYDLVADPDPSNTLSVKGKRVIELGAGTGALSVGLARAGAASVTCTDLPCHIPRIKATVEANTTDEGGVNCRRNGSMDTGGSLQGSTTMGRVGDGDVVGSVHVLPLRWGDDIYSIRSMDALPGQAVPVAGGGGAAGVSIVRGNGFSGDGAVDLGREAIFGRKRWPAFDLIVLSEVLYWPALDLLVEDTREPLRSTLVELSDPGTMVVLVFKERWPDRERSFLISCERHFHVTEIPRKRLEVPANTREHPGSDAIRAVAMLRLPQPASAIA